jgi:uncharacterized membrane protein
VSTRASIYRHPIHPMLIVFPLGLWIFSVICYLIYLLSSVSVWHTVALYAMGGGIIGGVVAAVPGAIDFLTLPKSRVQTIALSHMISNVVALTIFIITFSLAVFGNEQSVVPFALSLFGLLAVGTGGWLGGALVYEHGVGVEQKQAQEAEYQHV